MSLTPPGGGVNRGLRLKFVHIEAGCLDFACKILGIQMA